MKWHHSKKEIRKIYEDAEFPYGQIGMVFVVIIVLILHLTGYL
jgi:hypothetical protein